MDGQFSTENCNTFLLHLLLRLEKTATSNWQKNGPKSCKPVIYASYFYLCNLIARQITMAIYQLQDCLTDPCPPSILVSSLRVEQLHIAILTCPCSKWALQWTECVISWTEWTDYIHPNGVRSVISNHAGVTGIYARDHTSITPVGCMLYPCVLA